MQASDGDVSDSGTWAHEPGDLEASLTDQGNVIFVDVPCLCGGSEAILFARYRKMTEPRDGLPCVELVLSTCPDCKGHGGMQLIAVPAQKGAVH